MKWYHKLDFTIILTWAALVSIGLVAIYSATHGPAASFLPSFVLANFEKQLIFAVISLVGMAIALALPIRIFQLAAFPFYVFTLLLMVAALIFGREVNGAKSWLFLGPIQLQVSEFAKVGTILAVAQLFSLKRPTSGNVRYALLAVLIIMLPAALTVMQNDTGTALVFMALVPVMLFWSGLPASVVLLIIVPPIVGYLTIWNIWIALIFSVMFVGMLLWRVKERYIAIAGAAFSIGVAALVKLGLAMLPQNYQVRRLLSFTNPEAAEFRDNVGFHLVQSKAAIGSGGFFGKGFMQGTQTQGAYVPEQWTDFVFSVIGEEWGFVGSFIVLALFAYLLIRLLMLGTQVKHPFAVMIASGTVGIFLIHIFINIGMATGIMPVIGIPLPFMSYGGSSMLANSALIAIMLNLYMRREDFSLYGY